MSASRTFRVFVSSTFADLVEERNALQRRVWPELAKLCEKAGFRFQAIDLRWGVPNEAALDQRTSRICLAGTETLPDDQSAAQLRHPCSVIATVGDRCRRDRTTRIRSDRSESDGIEATDCSIASRMVSARPNAVPAVYYLRSRRSGTQEADENGGQPRLNRPSAKPVSSVRRCRCGRRTILAAFITSDPSPNAKFLPAP